MLRCGLYHDQFGRAVPLQRVLTVGKVGFTPLVIGDAKPGSAGNILNCRVEPVNEVRSDHAEVESSVASTNFNPIVPFVFSSLEALRTQADIKKRQNAVGHGRCLRCRGKTLLPLPGRRQGPLQLGEGDAFQPVALCDGPNGRDLDPRRHMHRRTLQVGAIPHKLDDHLAGNRPVVRRRQGGAPRCSGSTACPWPSPAHPSCRRRGSATG